MVIYQKGHTDCDVQKNTRGESLHNNKLVERLKQFVKNTDDETISTTREYLHGRFTMASEYAVFSTTGGTRSQAVHTRLECGILGPNFAKMMRKREPHPPKDVAVACILNSQIYD